MRGHSKRGEGAAAGPRDAGPFFPLEEYERRVTAARAAMAARGLSLCLIASPENVYYLTGLDHWGYFAPHLLVLPAAGTMVLITRAMERVTVARQVRNAIFEGHSDSETAADAAARVLAAYQTRDVGLETWSSGLPHGLVLRLQERLPGFRGSDVTGMIDEIRRVKSPLEMECLRAAAAVSVAAMAAAIESAREGASEGEIAGACHKAMFEAGGSYPGFGPFIRPRARLEEEHTSWGGARLGPGDSLFLELSGCVRRYHAPMGRLVHLGPLPGPTREMKAVCEEAFAAVLQALRPGALAREVYAAWQTVVDRHGLGHYRRHHCGYLVGIGLPPTWTGGPSVTGLRHDSDLEIQAGMSFHILSWLMGTGRGDYFLSNTVLLGSSGAEVLTALPG